MSPERAFVQGERVMCGSRVGSVKRIDWGGIHVELDPTDTEGRELVVCLPESVMSVDIDRTTGR
jgi:hypothetical protein